MPGAKKNYFGLEGFVWYIGVVEDRKDPDKLGRVRVRCFGWHTEDKELIPTNALPWAHPMFPANLPAIYTPKEGDMVFGFFLDGDSAQNPVIMGVLPGIPIAYANKAKGFNDPNGKYPKRINEQTTSRLARNRPEETIIEKRKRGLKKGVKSAGGVTWSEPSPSFAPEYPYNYAHETESGHAFEMDDTKGKERVHLAHKIGSFIEMDYDGSRIEKVIKDNYTVIMGSDYLYVQGKCSITVDGDCNLKVAGKINVEAAEINMAASGDVKIKGKSVKIEADTSMDLKSGTAFNAGGGKSASISAGATATIQGKTVDLAGKQVNLQMGFATPPSTSGLSVSPSTTSTSNTSTSNTSTSNTSTTSTTTTTAGSSNTTTTSSTTGKSTDAKTITVSDRFNAAMGTVTQATKDLATTMPIGELTSKMQSFETNINSLVGDVISLPTDQRTQVQTGSYNVYLGAKDKGIEINLAEPLIPPEKLTQQVTYQIGKQLYPRTEVVEKTGDG